MLTQRSLAMAVMVALIVTPPAFGANTTRISVSAGGAQANSNSFVSTLTSDGRYIAFESLASNLVSTNTNGKSQIYIKDTSTGGIQLISMNGSGVAGNANSVEPSISGDGRYVAFTSDATNLIANDGNGLRDVFIFDRNSSSIMRVSPSGVEPNGISHMPYLSRDGKYLVISSLATNFAVNDTNSFRDIFLYQLSSGILKRINTSATGEQANSDSFASGISSDGNYVAFVSSASNLAPNDSNSVYDIFLFDNTTGKNELISVASNGTLGNNVSTWPSVSDDGRIVAYISLATNLVTGDTNGKYDVFMRDRKFSTTTRISVDSTGNQANEFSWHPFVSGNGRYLVFWSFASNLIANDNNGQGDIFIHDRIKNTLERINVDTTGSEANSLTDRSLGVSHDGLIVSFNSFASNLVVGDSNLSSDVYTRLRDAPLNTVPIANAGTAQSQECTAGSATFQLDGSASVDADEDVLSYTWAGDFGSISGVNPSLSLPLGLHTTTLTVNDGHGGSASANVDLRVTDTKAPALSVATAASIEASSIKGASYALSYQASDTCSAVTVSTNPSLSVYPLGVTMLTLTAKDAAGNTSTQNIKITVQDTTRPVLTVPADVVREATAATTVVDFGQASATDVFPVTITNNAPASFPLGTSTITWTATDSNGNASTVSQRVTLRDTTAPKLTIPVDISAPATGMYTVIDIGQATATDAFATTVTNDMPSKGFSLGTTLVTWTATDSNGNSTYAQQRVTLADNSPPVLSLPADISAEANALLSSVNIGTASALDLVDGVVAVTNDAPILFPLGTTIVNWSAVDSQGNRISKQQTITVADTTSPVLSLPMDLTVEATAVTTPLADINLGKATATDIFTVTISNDAPAAGYPLGTTVVTWTAQDANKNVSRGRQHVTLQDATAPVISAPGDITMEATGPTTLVTLGKAIAHDLFSFNITQNAPSNGFTVGTTPVVWTATDSSGNHATATQFVTIADTTPPTLIAPRDISVEANALLTTPVILGSASALDLVDGATIVTHNAPNAFALGTTHVTYTTRDARQNLAQAIQRVTVIDTTAPALLAPADLLVEATGVQTPINIGNATATDIFAVKIANNAPGSFALGTTVVTWLATDVNANVSKAQQKVTVVDTTAPRYTFELVRSRIDQHHHKMVHVANIANISDLVDAKPNVAIDVTYTPAERHMKHTRDNADWEVKKVGNTWQVWVRAKGEQQHRKERIYSINLTVSDSTGNSATESKHVTVKHDRGHENEHEKR